MFTWLNFLLINVETKILEFSVIAFRTSFVYRQELDGCELCDHVGVKLCMRACV